MSIRCERISTHVPMTGASCVESAADVGVTTIKDEVLTPVPIRHDGAASASVRAQAPLPTSQFSEQREHDGAFFAGTEVTANAGRAAVQRTYQRRIDTGELARPEIDAATFWRRRTRATRCLRRTTSRCRVSTGSRARSDRAAPRATSTTWRPIRSRPRASDLPRASSVARHASRPTTRRPTRSPPSASEPPRASSATRSPWRPTTRDRTANNTHETATRTRWTSVARAAPAWTTSPPTRSRASGCRAKRRACTAASRSRRCHSARATTPRGDVSTRRRSIAPLLHRGAQTLSKSDSVRRDAKVGVVEVQAFVPINVQREGSDDPVTSGHVVVDSVVPKSVVQSSVAIQRDDDRAVQTLPQASTQMTVWFEGW